MLILVRHGQTTYNNDKRFTGMLDAPLSELGQQQALEAGDSLRTVPIHAVFTSTLERAKVTAGAIAAAQKFPPALYVDCPALNERSYGLIEGFTIGEARAQFPPKKYKQWDRDYFEAPPSGESLADVADRLLPFYHEQVVPLLQRGKTVCIVSHSGIMKVLIGHLSKMNEGDIVEMRIENAVPYEFSLSKLGIDLVPATL